MPDRKNANKFLGVPIFIVPSLNKYNSGLLRIHFDYALELVEPLRGTTRIIQCTYVSSIKCLTVYYVLLTHTVCGFEPSLAHTFLLQLNVFSTALKHTSWIRKRILFVAQQVISSLRQILSSSRANNQFIAVCRYCQLITTLHCFFYQMVLFRS